MDQRKLSRTIEKILSEAPNVKSTEELLSYTVKQIIAIKYVGITGGRIWKLKDNKNSYKLIEQIGDVDIIDTNYELRVKDYAVTKEVGLKRTVTMTETDKYLKKKGIYHYSATGVGKRFKIKKQNETYYLYQYLIGLNGNKIDDEFLYSLNIISTTINSILGAKRIETKAKENILELEKASAIQKSILPDHLQKFGNYEIFGISLPDKIVGGDFFDYILADEDNKLFVVIGDAASKGISAAAQALYVSGALKMGLSGDSNINTIFRKINNLVNETFPDERFVTIFLCELYKDNKGLCIYINAGHNSPYFLNYTNDSIYTLHSTGPVIGPSPNQRYFTDSIYLNVNDILLLYTDGIVEATNENFEFFGEEKLKELLISNKNLTPEVICQKILQEVQTFSANGKYSDDKTLVVIKRIK